MSEGGQRSWRRGRPSMLAARLVATGFTALFFAFAISEGGGTEGMAFLIVLSLAAAAAALAWWDASLGTLALIAAGLALAAFGLVAANRNQVPVALLLGAPYFLSAALLSFGASRLARG